MQISGIAVANPALVRKMFAPSNRHPTISWALCRPLTEPASSIVASPAPER
jgi:hypothetical protein